MKDRLSYRSQDRHLGVQVPEAMIWQCKSGGAAFTLACNVSGLEDKEIYLELDIDAGTFSRIKAGKANFPDDKIKRFCEIVNNKIYPQWKAYQVGCRLVLIESEAERMYRLQCERAEEAEKKLAFAMEMLQGRSVK